MTDGVRNVVERLSVLKDARREVKLTDKLVLRKRFADGLSVHLIVKDQVLEYQLVESPIHHDGFKDLLEIMSVLELCRDEAN